jgi:hypothetical protein
MQDFFKKVVFFDKKVCFLVFFTIKFGHIKKKLYLCIRFQKQTSLTIKK